MRHVDRSWAPVWAVSCLLVLTAVVSLGAQRPAAAEAATGERVLVGTIAGGDALIALVVRNSEVVVHTAGGSGTVKTHSGWFSTRVAGTRLVGARSASGLVLTGTVERERASGTLRLAGGTTVAWQALTAKDGSPAGLKVKSSPGRLIGLIVTNDGKRAATSQVTTATGVGFTPVTVTAPVTTGPTPVTVPGQAGTVVVTPVVDPRRVTITRQSPIIVVLLHGATTGIPRPNTQDVQRDGVPGTRKHARRYWTYPFVASLLGADPARRAPLTTLAGNDVTGDTFLTGHLTLPGDDVDEVPSPSSCTFDDLVTAETFPTPAAQRPGQPPAAPRLSLLLGHRNGKIGLVEQTMDATDQIFACVSIFEQRFQQKPALVFVAHSYGGLVTRTIFSAPGRTALAAVRNPDTGDRLRFPAAASKNARYDTGANPVRAKMNVLGGQTLYAVTMSTPHEGTRLMDAAGQAQQVLRLVRGGAAGLSTAQQRLRDRLRATLALLLDVPPNGALDAAQAVAALDSVEQLLDENRVVAEARTGLWRALNTGPLHPTNARRSPASPMVGAAGELIPIYTTGGRNPGGQVLDTLDLGNVRSSYDRLGQLQLGERVKTQLHMTAAVDYLYAFLDATQGGPKRPPAGLAGSLDRTARVDWITATTTLADSVVPQLNQFFRAELGGDTQSILRFLERRFGVRANLNAPLFLNERFAIDLGGTTRVPVPRLACGATTITLDYGPFVRGVGTAYGSLTGASQSLRAANLAELIAALGTASASLRALGTGTLEWFSDRVRALQGVSASCRDARGLNLWRLSWPSTSVPAPRVVATGVATGDEAVDHDGLVEYDSAMGVRLGTTTNNFFDHARNDARAGRGEQGPGSWYRRYRSDVEQFSHEVMRAESGRFVWQNILSRGPGPLARNQGDLSVHP